MRESNRRGKKPDPRAQRSAEQPTEVAPADHGPAESAAQTQSDASAQAAGETVAQTIKVPSLQELQGAQPPAAEDAHAVDTEGMVQDAQSGRNRRADRRKEAQAPKSSAPAKIVRVLVVLAVAAGLFLLVPRDWLNGLSPDKLLGALHPTVATAEPTLSPSPLPTATPTPQPTADLGSSVVILDAADGLPSFGATFEDQLKKLGEAKHVKSEYVRSDAAGFSDAYQRLVSSGTPPVFVVGPYGKLHAMTQELSDLKDAGAQLGLNTKLLALGGDSHILPLSVRPNGVFLRKSLWKSPLPKSYEELLTGLKALGGNAPESFPLGLPLGCAAGEAFCRDMLAAYGADVTNPSACNPQDVALALAWFQSAFDGDLAPTDSLHWDQTQARNAIATVSVATAGDGTLLQGLDPAIAADLVLLPPLQGPKGRFCTAQLMGMAMPKAAKPEAARLFFETCLVQQKGLDTAMQGEQGDALPTSDKALAALDPAKNPWSHWLDQMEGVSVRADAPDAKPSVSQAVAAVAVGSYTPDEAAQWLLKK